MKDDVVTRHIIKLLRRKAIPITEARVNITAIIYRSPKWLSLSDIVRKVNNTHDRVTIYRALCLLVNHGFVQKLVDIEKISYYFFNHELTKNEKVQTATEHTYFKCITCGGITILPDIDTGIPLPEGFIKTGGNLVISGYCGNCSPHSN
jgi:Fur family ferric uptake transcriptional regulator